jgi:hypothetical protein
MNFCDFHEYEKMFKNKGGGQKIIQGRLYREIIETISHAYLRLFYRKFLTAQMLENIQRVE